MKKSVALIALTAVALGSMAISTMATASKTPKNIGAEKAKEVALEHAKFAAEDVTFTKTELDYDNGVAVYDVEFFVNNVEYDYEIDALEGNVRVYDIDNNEIITNSDMTPEVVVTAPTTQAEVDTNVAVTSTQITTEKAKDIALAHAKLNSSDVTFTKAELDYDDGVAVYEVEFYRNNVEYDYEIHAASGAIIDYSVDHD